ncbi:MAG: hypothetical protein M3Q65_12200 [Chloroflexota bacterium]|nr:hypothetical protein [Chloroflexota bacterium]
MSGGSAGRVVRVFLVWAGVHSLLASKQVKNLVRRVAGPRARNGLYRPFYIAQSLATVGWGAVWFLRLPDRELYRVRAPWSWLLYLGQAASVAVLLSGVRVYGLLRFYGLTQLRAWLAGRDPGPEPEAQGPPPGPDGELVAAGPWRFTRHPDNLPALTLFLLFPRMTVNRAALAAMTALYTVLGSLHEDARLRAAYGPAFERYRRAVPFLLPRLRPPSGADEGGSRGSSA